MIVREFAQMIAPNQPVAGREPAADGPPSASDLPFRIELWDEGQQALERVIARAHSAKLAEVIFKAAREQFPGRLLRLWHGADRVADTED